LYLGAKCQNLFTLSHSQTPKAMVGNATITELFYEFCKCRYCDLLPHSEATLTSVFFTESIFLSTDPFYL
jgi:hypothetical protein